VIWVPAFAGMTLVRACALEADGIMAFAAFRVAADMADYGFA
jgi:hypothetical protein